MYKQGNNFSSFQSFGNILGFLLPILQIFFQFIPGVSTSIFLIREHFLLVSVFAALISYILIIVVKNIPWIQITIGKKEKYLEWLSKTNARAYGEEEIREYLRKNPRVDPPFAITYNNIFLVLLPLVLISFMLFFIFGLIGQDLEAENIVLTILQAFSYILLISSSTLVLAIYYIKDMNTSNYKRKERDRVSEIIKLALEFNIFEEMPRVSLIGQWQTMDFPGQYTFVFKVNTRYYIIAADPDLNKIERVEQFENYDDLKNQGK